VKFIFFLFVNASLFSHERREGKRISKKKFCRKIDFKNRDGKHLLVSIHKFIHSLAGFSKNLFFSVSFFSFVKKDFCLLVFFISWLSFWFLKFFLFGTGFFLTKKFRIKKSRKKWILALPAYFRQKMLKDLEFFVRNQKKS